MTEEKSMQACPFCGEDILSVAIKCKHCGSDLSGSRTGDTPPKANEKEQEVTDLSSEDTGATTVSEKKIGRSGVVSVVILVVVGVAAAYIHHLRMEKRGLDFLGNPVGKVGSSPEIEKGGNKGLEGNSRETASAGFVKLKCSAAGGEGYVVEVSERRIRSENFGGLMKIDIPLYKKENWKGQEVWMYREFAGEMGRKAGNVFDVFAFTLESSYLLMGTMRADQIDGLERLPCVKVEKQP